MGNQDFDYVADCNTCRVMQAFATFGERDTWWRQEHGAGHDVFLFRQVRV